MKYTYHEDSKAWVDESDYQYYLGKGFIDVESTPDQFVITQDEVKNMSIDGNNNTDPEHGLIYDGSAEPGTPF